MTQQLTVLQILPQLELGGVERGTLEVANILYHPDIVHWLYLVVDEW